MSRISRAGLTAAAIALIADRVSKYVMIERVMRPPGVMETPFFSAKVIRVLPIFDLRLTWNPGISFSMFNSGDPRTLAVLLALQGLITAVLLWYLMRQTKPWMQAAVGLIVGGAVGNIIDRIMFKGAVADFLDFHLGEWHFPTFNLADSCITIGVFLWLLDACGLSPHHPPAPQKD